MHFGCIIFFSVHYLSVLRHPATVAAIAAMAAASATMFSASEPTKICEPRSFGLNVDPDPDGETGGSVGDVWHAQVYQGSKPHPDSWVRPCYKGMPDMDAWLALMNEVGRFFPAKGTHKELGVSSKRSYTDFVMRFADWHRQHQVGLQQPNSGVGTRRFLLLPPNFQPSEKAAACVINPLPPYLALLPSPSISLLVEYLRWEFVKDCGAKQPRRGMVMHAMLSWQDAHNRPANMHASMPH